MAIFGIGKKTPAQIRAEIKSLEAQVTELENIRVNMERNTDYLRSEREKNPTNDETHRRLVEAEAELTRTDMALKKLASHILGWQERLKKAEKK